MTANKHLEITQENYYQLKAAYELALEEQKNIPSKNYFEFGGELFYIPFTPFRLEHIRNILGITEPHN